MGKKPQKHSWPEAKKLCRLNQDDIERAKRLGFGPDALIRARPDPKQKWKLPVKYWVRDLHERKFGHIIGEKAYVPPPEPAQEPYDEDAARLYGEQVYWDDYWGRNQEDRAEKGSGGKLVERPSASKAPYPEFLDRDGDVPF